MIASWFSPNYHQLSPTIIHMVKRPMKFLIADDSSPAVPLAKSREQRVPNSFHVKMSQTPGRASYSSIRRNIRSLLHLAALPILPDERLVTCMLLPFAVSLLILANWRFLQKISSLCYLGLQYFLFMIIILNINTNFWSCSWASRGTFGRNF